MVFVLMKTERYGPLLKHVAFICLRVCIRHSPRATLVCPRILVEVRDQTPYFKLFVFLPRNAQLSSRLRLLKTTIPAF